MKKKLLHLHLMTFLMATTFSFSFVSCGGDDDDDNSSASVNDTSGRPMENPGMFGLNGKHLVQVYLQTYTYYENGALLTIKDDNYGYTYTFSEDQKIMEATHSYHSYKNYKNAIAYNRLGYIASMITISELEDVDVEPTDAAYTYDRDGHLTNFGSYDLKWVNGNLVEISDKKYASDHGYTTYTLYTLEYSEKYPNKYHQFVKPMLGFTKRLNEYLAYIGFFGKGSEYFPIRVNLESVYLNDRGQANNKTKTVNYKYEYNDDGTVSACIGDDGNSSCSYYYYK
ncbi:MAG: hypothetical protein IKY01_13480 [Prevotella sp.]|nr:hypothetical protein [Prevotella sp.]